MCSTYKLRGVRIHMIWYVCPACVVRVCCVSVCICVRSWVETKRAKLIWLLSSLNDKGNFRGRREDELFMLGWVLPRSSPAGELKHSV